MRSPGSYWEEKAKMSRNIVAGEGTLWQRKKKRERNRSICGCLLAKHHCVHMGRASGQAAAMLDGSTRCFLTHDMTLGNSFPLATCRLQGQDAAALRTEGSSFDLQ